MREEKAITLVSLVVTIIVLLILAGVSVNMVIGDEGIIKIAKDSRQNIEDTLIEKQTRLNNLYTETRTDEDITSAIDAMKKLSDFKIAMAEVINEATKEKGRATSLTEHSETTKFTEAITEMFKILTEDATAEEGDIAEGKTAYVNGQLITGTATEETTPPGDYIGTVSGKATIKLDVSKVREDYASLTADNFFVRITGYTLAYTVSDSTAAHAGLSKSITCSQTYNASTGILTLKNYGYTYTYNYGDVWTKTLSVKATLQVYCTNEPIGDSLSGSMEIIPIG